MNIHGWRARSVERSFMDMKNALVLLGHADPKSFNARLAGAYHDGLVAAGASSTLVRIADLSFDPVLRKGYRAPQPLEPDLARVKALIDAADHVAWFFPMYWADAPAIVRGLCDRLMLPGWAFRYEPGELLQRRLLGGRTGRVVVTMDSPWWYYTLVRNRAIHASFVSGTLEFVGFDPVRVTTIHSVRGLGDASRSAWVERVAREAKGDLAMTPRRPRELAGTTARALPAR